MAMAAGGHDAAGRMRAAKGNVRLVVGTGKGRGTGCQPETGIRAGQCCQRFAGIGNREDVGFGHAGGDNGSLELSDRIAGISPLLVDLKGAMFVSISSSPSNNTRAGV